jgi:hypothetical protein
MMFMIVWGPTGFSVVIAIESGCKFNVNGVVRMEVGIVEN